MEGKLISILQKTKTIRQYLENQTTNHFRKNFKLNKRIEFSKPEIRNFSQPPQPKQNLNFQHKLLQQHNKKITTKQRESFEEPLELF